MWHQLTDTIWGALFLGSTLIGMGCILFDVLRERIRSKDRPRSANDNERRWIRCRPSSPSFKGMKRPREVVIDVVKDRPNSRADRPGR